MRAFLTCRLIRSLLNWACNKRFSSLSLMTNNIEKRCRYHSSSWVDLSRLSGFCLSFVCTSIFRYLLLMWMNYIQSYANQTICKPQYNPGLNGHDIVHAVLWRLSNRQGEHCEGGFVQKSQGVGMCGGGKETHRWIAIKVLMHSYRPSEGGISHILVCPFPTLATMYDFRIFSTSYHLSLILIIFLWIFEFWDIMLTSRWSEHIAGEGKAEVTTPKVGRSQGEYAQLPVFSVHAWMDYSNTSMFAPMWPCECMFPLCRILVEE